MAGPRIDLYWSVGTGYTVRCRNDVPKAPDERHDGISASCTSSVLSSQRNFKLTLMLLDSYYLSDRSLKHTDIPIGDGSTIPLSSFLRVHDSYPFSRPPRARPRSATGRLGAKPKRSILNSVPANPDMRTGFRPTLSLNLPHNTLEENSANAKADVIIPA